jgi:hypothetical protein
VGDAKPREHVVLDDLSGAPDGGTVGNSPDHGEDSEIGSDDSITLGGVENDGVGIEVVGPKEG